MDKLISFTDENSILITAEFVYQYQEDKVGDKEFKTFDIDLIVNNQITIEQLMIAIEEGLEHRIAKLFEIKQGENIYKYLYQETQEKHQGTIKKRWFSVKKTRKGKITQDDKAEEIDEEIYGERILTEPEDKGKINEIISERDFYLICWRVFKLCQKQGKEFQKAIHKSEHNKQMMSVSIGNINPNQIPEDTKICETDARRYCIREILSDPNIEKDHTRLKDLGFITSTKLVFDSSDEYIHNNELIKIGNTGEKYNISEYPLAKMNDEPVQIIPPSEMPKKSKLSIITTVLTPVLTMGTMFVVRLFTSNSGAGSMLIMSGAMCGVSLFVSALNIHERNKEYRENLSEWKTQYENYIRNLLEKKIKARQADDIAKLKVLYPATVMLSSNRKEKNESLIKNALDVKSNIFTHGSTHPDYLSFRIGYSDSKSELVTSIFDIIGEKREAIFTSVTYYNIDNEKNFPFTIQVPNNGIQKFKENNYLINLPEHISKHYRYLKGAPVRISFKEIHSLGILFNSKNDSFFPFLSNLIFDLCYYQSPEDIQFVFFFDETEDFEERQKLTNYYKHLPHFRELLGNLSSFVFQKDDSEKVLNKILEILSDRRSADKATKFPHIVLIFINDYEFKRHPVSNYLPVYGEKEQKYNDISFVFCKHESSELPKYCEKIIEKIGNDWYLLPHVREISMISSEQMLFKGEARYKFHPDLMLDENDEELYKKIEPDYCKAYKTISALYYERIAKGADIPSSVELFDLILDKTDNKLDNDMLLRQQVSAFISNSWGLSKEIEVDKTRVTHSLSVPIGRKAGGMVELDLHEKADGPHMLVAGTTGSGKTETVLTYLIMLCATFSPEEVNLLLMDMKGAGFVQRIGDLPHVVGKVTDIAGDETGTGTAYMLRRFQMSMDAEVKNRKNLLNKMGVDSVDGYFTAKADPQKHLDTHPQLKNKLKMDDINSMPNIPHLFLVVDEFTELMQFNDDNGGVDFKKSITSLARVGRSLGFHIILISQNIESAITPDIRVNSRARLCLKVATREASKEMIGNDDAYGPLMPGNGRAYLYIGAGSRFEYFQSGYSGADIKRNLQAPIVITNAETSGEYSLFYDSENKEFMNNAITGKDKTGITQLSLLVDQIKLCFNQQKRIKRPAIIFQDPLPAFCYYKFNWETQAGEFQKFSPSDEFRENGKD